MIWLFDGLKRFKTLLRRVWQSTTLLAGAKKRQTNSRLYRYSSASCPHAEFLRAVAYWGNLDASHLLYFALMLLDPTEAPLELLQV
uniref:Uncharacterized protein n=1 Tax=Plectus sambesii TaxID=2011161 RepID=A0A914UJU8_9BILA